MIVERVAFPNFDPEKRLAVVQARYEELIVGNIKASQGKSHEFATYEATCDFQRDPDGYRRKAELLQRFWSIETGQSTLGDLDDQESFYERVAREPITLHKGFMRWLDEYNSEQNQITTQRRLEIESAYKDVAGDLLSALLNLQSLENEMDAGDSSVFEKVWRAHDPEDFYKHAYLLAAFRAAIIDMHTDAGKSQGQANDAWESWLIDTGAPLVLARARDWFLDVINAPENQASGPPSS